MNRLTPIAATNEQFRARAIAAILRHGNSYTYVEGLLTVLVPYSTYLGRVNGKETYQGGYRFEPVTTWGELRAVLGY